MVRWLKIGAGVLGGVVVLAAAAIATGELLAQRRAERTIDIKVTPVAYREGAAAVERGAYLYASRGCADCHGADGAGRLIVDDGAGTRLSGPNVTTGNPAIANYQPEDWVRTIRHGVRPNGQPLRLMPSEDFNRLTDHDLAAVVAFVRQLPPASGQLRATLQYPLPARVLYGFGVIPDAVDRIDHSLPPSTPVPEAETIEHGAYVAMACIGCHGEDLSGGRIVTGPPDWPPAARLRGGPDSAMARYADAEAFVAMLRSGKRPDGSEIAVMPFESLARFSDVDARALYLYLKGLPSAAR